MNNLPIPKLRASWLSALVLTAVLFHVYYTFLYGLVLQEYTNQFRDVTYLSSKSEDEGLRDLKITAHIPKYIYSVEPIWVFITVQNTGPQTFLDTKIDLNVSLTSSMLLLPSTFSEDKDEPYKTNIEIKEIGPGSIVFGRIPLIVQSGIDIKSIWIHTGIKGEHENEKPINPVQSERFPQSKPIPTEHPWRALQHSFIQNILLPPWSNGLIFALVLFSSYLAHDRKFGKDDEDEPDIWSREMLVSFWHHLGRTIIILYVFLILILIISFGWVKSIALAILPLLILAFLLVVWTLSKKFFGRIIEFIQKGIKNITNKFKDFLGNPSVKSIIAVIPGILLLIGACFVVLLPDSTQYLSLRIRIALVFILTLLGLLLAWLGLPGQKNSISPPSVPDGGDASVENTEESPDSNEDGNFPESSES